jgi:hypothetical protein
LNWKARDRNGISDQKDEKTISIKQRLTNEKARDRKWIKGSKQRKRRSAISID